MFNYFCVLVFCWKKSGLSKVTKTVMLEKEEGVKKLKDLLKNKDSQISDSEAEKIAQNLYDLGLFLVHSKIKNINDKK